MPAPYTWDTGVDNVEGLDPRYLYNGKSYSDYATDWLNWFLSSKADNRNAGPAVFLRSKHVPDRSDQVYELEVSHYTTTAATSSAQDDRRPSLYVNEPNIRVGIDRLQIFDDQAVFVPIIVAIEVSSLPYQDWGYLQEFTGLTIDVGDNPPDLRQLTINEQEIALPDGDENFINFRISTPIFTAVVPEAPYGTSTKDFLEGGPLSPGFYPAMIAGYFVMFKFPASNTSYWVHSYASAGRDVRGPYFSELLYQIDVEKRPPLHGRITVSRPASFQASADRALKQLKETFPTPYSDIEAFTSNWKSLKPNIVISKVALQHEEKELNVLKRMKACNEWEKEELQNQIREMENQIKQMKDALKKRVEGKEGEVRGAEEAKAETK